MERKVPRGMPDDEARREQISEYLQTFVKLEDGNFYAIQKGGWKKVVPNSNGYVVLRVPATKNRPPCYITETAMRFAWMAFNQAPVPHGYDVVLKAGSAGNVTKQNLVLLDKLARARRVCAYADGRQAFVDGIGPTPPADLTLDLQHAWELGYLNQSGEVETDD